MTKRIWNKIVYCHQMYLNYKQDETDIKSIIHRYTSPFEHDKCIENQQFIIYLFQFKMGVVQFKMGIVQFKME